MGFITTLLFGAIAGAAGTWAYLRSKSETQSVDSPPSVEAVSQEAAEEVQDAVEVEEEVGDTTVAE